MKVHQFMYTYCVCEGDDSAISTHNTKEGAYEAMRKYIVKSYNDWLSMRERAGKDRDHLDKWGIFTDHGVRTIELME